MGLPVAYETPNLQKVTLDITKCRKWHINPRILPALRLVFIKSHPEAMAARKYDLKPSHVYNVIWRLRKNGHLQEVIETLKPWNEEDTEETFYETVHRLMKIDEYAIEALKLYAEITGKTKKGPAVVQQTNIQINEATAKVSELKARFGRK